MTDRPQVPPEIIAKLGLSCLELPEAYQEPAWAGTRWRVGKQTFAHVLALVDGWPPAYARAVGAAAAAGQLLVLTFRLPVSQLEAPRFARAPFFRPVWFPNIAGVVLDERTDWSEIADLLVNSYCVMAPKKLVELVDRPGD